MSIRTFTEGDVSRFWSYVSSRGPGECWNWRTRKPGMFWIGGRAEKASRVSWVLAYGLIPVGMNVLHSCDNSSCVNPSHLFLGTQLDNIVDMVEKERGNNYGPVGVKNASHKLVEPEVRSIRKLLAMGLPQRYIASKFGVDQAVVWKINKGYNWSSVI